MPRANSPRTSCGGSSSSPSRKSVRPLARPPEEARKRRAVSIVEETYGSIKGLDRATLISLAEGEEYGGH
jgi:hypothetical protein